MKLKSELLSSTALVAISLSLRYGERLYHLSTSHVRKTPLHPIEKLWRRESGYVYVISKDNEAAALSRMIGYDFYKMRLQYEEKECHAHSKFNQLNPQANGRIWRR